MFSSSGRLVFLILTATVIACSSGHRGTAVISGAFEGGQKVRLLLEELDPMGTVPVDSALTNVDGSFLFEVSPKEAGYYILKTGDGRMTVITLAPSDTVNIRCSLNSFPENITLKGPEDARLLNEFYSFTSRLKKRSDSLQEVLVSHRGDSLFVPLTLKFDSLFQEIWENQRQYEISFLQTQPGSLSSLIVVNYSFGVRPVLSMEEDLKYYKAVDSALTARYPGNRHVEYNSRKIADFERQQKLREGAKP
jgi:hypothetical protein